MIYEYMHREERYPISVSCEMDCRTGRGLWTLPTMSWTKTHENPMIPSMYLVCLCEDRRYVEIGGIAGRGVPCCTTQ